MTFPFQPGAKPRAHHTPDADLNSGLFRCPTGSADPCPRPRASQPHSTRLRDHVQRPARAAEAASEDRGRGGTSRGLRRTRGAGPRGRGRHAREAPTGWRGGWVGHGPLGSRLLARFQKAAGDFAAPTEEGPEPWSRRCAQGAARAGAPPRRPGSRAAPPPLPGGSGQRLRRRPGRGPKEPLRPPGHPSAGRRGSPRRAGGAGPGECLCTWQP